ncbi:MAG: hypothetical protein STSR0008_13820 [Ignavibacterium sp.]
MIKKYKIILMVKNHLRILLFLYFLFNENVFTQELIQDTSKFVKRNGNSLWYEGKPFYSIGVNSYYLQNLYAYNDTNHLIEIFREAKEMGINVIRTWGFYDSSDSTDNAVIQISPEIFNEKGLLSLDYVIAKANEYNIKLIIPFINNWEDYGGMNQYVKWYSEFFPSPLNKKEEIQSKLFKQKIIEGINGRFYRFFITTNLTHDDFYTNETIKNWFKNYISTLLNRTNSFTKIKYKNEPSILAWELANEPRSSDISGNIIYNWADEISNYIKSIDSNHLISTGEEGFDITPTYYDAGKYSEQKWMFDGSSGISFYKNISLENIDIASIHFYPEGWGLSKNAGTIWLNVHKKIANEFNKPIILGEIATRQNVHLFYESIFNDCYYQDFSFAIPWQFVYDDRPDYDGYSFYYPQDFLITNVIQKYSKLFYDKQFGISPSVTSKIQLQNYPNPFNQVTIITYNLPEETFVDISIFNITGQFIKSLINEVQVQGNHSAIFDGSAFASGIYFVRLNTKNNSHILKINLIR